MADSLGPVPIPEPPSIGPFPLRVDYGTAKQVEPQVFVHKFDSPGLRTEQRIYRGDGSTRFRVRKWSLECHEYEELRDHWNQARGVWAKFAYTHPVDRVNTEQFTVHYGDPVVRFEHLAALAAGDPGLLLVAEPNPLVAPIYVSGAVSDGRPSAQLAGHLAKDRLKLIPIVEIHPRGGLAPLYLSDRRVTIDGNLYLPRLLDWSGLTQSVNQNNDSATFRFGNADNVWTTLVKTVNLKRAELRLSIFLPDHLERLDLWTGYIRDWTRDPASRQISVRAGEGAFEMTLPYPTRQITRTCWKEFKSPWCPYAGPLTTCAKSWEECQERGMTVYFGGIRAQPQDVRIKDNSTGTWGWGRSVMKSVSIAEDTIYQRVLQEIYTDIPMFVNCDVATGRDESEFYSALGVVGEGPLLGYSTDLTKHLLDDAPPHDPQKNGGWRGVTGRDPAIASHDYFGLSQAPWGSVPPKSTYAAGTAFAEIRRTDAKGLQLSKVSDRKMVVLVTGGLGGWVWTAPGARNWVQPLTNAAWLAANVYLRGLGMKADNTRPDLIPAEEMERWLDLPSIIDSAALCDLTVTKLVGAGQEKQFPYRGTIREQKALREWLTEILTCCLGYSFFVNRKLAIGIRMNSSVLAGNAFTRATVLQNGFAAEPREVSFNHLTSEFADDEFEWALNSVQVYDIDHAKESGTPAAPRFTVSRLALSGVSNKSQASRLTISRLREELGGTTVEEQAAARATRLRTSVIALGTLPGDVCSYDDPELPGGRIEFRVVSRTLNPDWTMDFEGVPSCDSMYDYTFGPKPDDVPAEPVPPERFQSLRGLAWLPNEESPVEGDPLYPLTRRSFALWQDYTLESEGTYSPSLVVRGERMVNQFLPNEAPLIHHVTWSQTGGTLAGGSTYYFVVAQRDAAGRFGQLSNIVAVWFPAGSDTYSVTLDPIESRDSTLPGYAVWMGTDFRRLVEQINAPATALPSSIAITGWTEIYGRGLPSAAAKAIRVKVKEVEHSGVAGLEVQEVIGTNQIVSSEFIGSTDNWIGQILSVVADADDGSVPLWNFRITAFNPATGVLTVDPPCVRETPEDSVEAGDVMIVRARATAATANSITNALWNNSIGENQWGAVDGLIPGAEVDLLIRIIAGKGAGQVRKVIANDHLTHTIDPPWQVIPDTTSVYIVEYPDWIHEATTSVTDVPLPGQDVEIGVRVDNLTGNVALVAGFLIDDEGNETAEELAVVREVYLYGQPYEVRRIQGGNTSLTDQTLRVDTTAGDVTVDLKLLDSLGNPRGSGGYYGRTILIVNDGTGAGAGRVIVKPLAGDQFTTGEEEVILENPGDWTEFVAGGDPADMALARRRHPQWNWSRRRLQHASTPLRSGRTPRRRMS